MEDMEAMEELDKRASHHHAAAEHGHKHFHVTHYLHRGENWGHLLATHVHEHTIIRGGARAHAARRRRRSTGARRTSTTTAIPTG